jgi:DUF1365 family protein
MCSSRELLVCAHRADGSLAAGVAEVNNTFGERHAYLLAGPELAWGREQMARKCFPCLAILRVQGVPRFASSAARSTLARVDLHDETARCCRPAWAARCIPERLHRAPRLLRHPLMTLGVIFRIHWQALRLWAKRLPFHGKPLRPSASSHDEHAAPC